MGENDLTDRTLFNSIKTIRTPAFLIFEDIDALFEERESKNKNTGLTFSGLLNALDGVYSKDMLEVFLTTNYKSKLDPALIRPGRISYVMTFDYANEYQIKRLFKLVTKGSPGQSDAFYESVKDYKVTTSIVSEYLKTYIDKPDEAITNYKTIELYF